MLVYVRSVFSGVFNNSTDTVFNNSTDTVNIDYIPWLTLDDLSNCVNVRFYDSQSLEDISGEILRDFRRFNKFSCTYLFLFVLGARHICVRDNLLSWSVVISSYVSQYVWCLPRWWFAWNVKTCFWKNLEKYFKSLNVEIFTQHTK